MALEHEESRREIGDEAVWSLSTAKPGNGVDQLRDSAFPFHPTAQLLHRVLHALACSHTLRVRQY